jgi:ribosomal protein L11 methyltransferase
MKGSELRRLSIPVAPESEEAVAELLDRIYHQWPTFYVDAETGRAVASLYLSRPRDWAPEKRARLRSGLKRIQQCGLELGPGRVSIARVRVEDWAESWKRHFHPLEIAHRLLVKPTWSRRRPRGEEAVVVLDPGLSFGTGHHPTTRFCLEELVACRRRGLRQSFLDIGTGSGILAIAAVKLGYQPVSAFDFDPNAVRTARENAEINGVSAELALRRRNLERLPPASRLAFDFICANLTDDLLLTHRFRIVNRLAPGGHLVLAGILQTRFPGLARQYQALGCRLVAQREEKEWRSGRFTLAA